MWIRENVVKLETLGVFHISQSEFWRERGFGVSIFRKIKQAGQAPEMKAGTHTHTHGHTHALMYAHTCMHALSTHAHAHTRTHVRTHAHALTHTPPCLVCFEDTVGRAGVL